MSLIIEDGTGVAGADSYASLANMTTYCTNFGYTAPPTSPLQEAFLRRAAIAMELIHWLGSKTTSTDSLAWPRANVIRRDMAVTDSPLPSNAIPIGVVNGQIQLALELYTLSVTPGIEAGASGRITNITEAVSGAVSHSKTYDNTGRSSPALPHAQSDAIFAPLVSFGNFSAMAYRA